MKIEIKTKFNIGDIVFVSYFDVLNVCINKYLSIGIIKGIEINDGINYIVQLQHGLLRSHIYSEEELYTIDEFKKEFKNSVDEIIKQLNECKKRIDELDINNLYDYLEKNEKDNTSKK